MVRLLQLTELMGLIDAMGLSIPQWCDCCLDLVLRQRSNLSFQSHNGAIAATARCATASTTPFFQSHNGAIAAPATIVTFYMTDTFQSHNGAIAADTIERIAEGINLSIPQWCDCCRARP